MRALVRLVRWFTHVGRATTPAWGVRHGRIVVERTGPAPARAESWTSLPWPPTISTAAILDAEEAFSRSELIRWQRLAEPPASALLDELVRRGAILRFTVRIAGAN